MPAEIPAWLHKLSVAEHAISDPGFYVQLLCGSVVCCAAFCMGYMLIYLQNILKPLVFSIFLMYLLSPVVQLLTTPIRIKRLPLLQRNAQRKRRRASEGGDVEEELCALVQPGEASGAVAAERASVHPVGVQVACPDWLAILVVLAVLFALLWFLCNAFIAGCSSLQAKFPVYRVELLRLLESFTRWLERIEPRAKDVLLAGVEKWLRELPLPGLMEDTLSAFFGGMETLFLVSVRPKINEATADRASTLAPVPPSASQVLLFTVYLLQGRSAYGLQRADEFMQAEIDRQVRRYVVLKTAVCVGVGVLIGLIFSVLQLDLAFLVGLITFVANFVPNVGAIFATLLPMPLILLDPAVSVGVRALAFLLPLLVHTTVGNLIEPKMFGSSMELHPVIVLFALAFWGALWGISGAILSVPLTATCRIALRATRNPWSETLLRLLEGRRAEPISPEL